MNTQYSVNPDFFPQVVYGLAKERQITMYKIALYVNISEVHGLDNIRVEFL